MKTIVTENPQELAYMLAKQQLDKLDPGILIPPSIVAQYIGVSTDSILATFYKGYGKEMCPDPKDYDLLKQDRNYTHLFLEIVVFVRQNFQRTKMQLDQNGLIIRNPPMGDEILGRPALVTNLNKLDRAAVVEKWLTLRPEFRPAGTIIETKEDGQGNLIPVFDPLENNPEDISREISISENYYRSRSLRLKLITKIAKLSGTDANTLFNVYEDGFSTVWDERYERFTKKVEGTITGEST